MSHADRVEQDRRAIVEARQKGPWETLKVFTRLSGPGWLQSAITLGGGSLSSSLYLGVLAGFSLLWLQPIAMILGIVMLSAIGYVALATGQRPFAAINQHVNPVLGWGWAIATMMANLVWSLPQFALGTAAVRQNLLPTLLGPQSNVSDNTAKLLIVAVLFSICGMVVWFYDSGSKGIKIFEIILKIMVGVIVVCFFGVVVVMTTHGALNWSAVFAGLVPHFGLLIHPASTYDNILAQAGPFADFWRQQIVNQQRDVMISATATAVGINMTFLLPYSMLQKGWDRHFRGLAIFDLSTGLFIPFVLATGCVIIAAGAQFHTKYDVGLLDPSHATQVPAAMVAKYESNLDKRIRHELGDEAFQNLDEADIQTRRAALPRADKKLAAMIVKRDAFDLAHSLEPMTGRTFSHYVFGLGVVGMAISSIIILMLINGFVFCEMFSLPQGGAMHRFGCYLAGFTGALGPFIYAGKTQFWLAVPTSVFGMILLPIAYITFFFMMNNRELLGDAMPTGTRRWRWNLLMAVAVALATFGAAWSIWSRTMPIPGTSISVRSVAITVVVLFVLLAVIVGTIRRSRNASDQ